MARTAITKRSLVANGVLAVPTPTTLDATNHHVIEAGHPSNRILLLVKNTTATAKAVTVKAGDNPPALSTGQGDLVGSSLAQNASEYIGPFESARFLQNDGTISVDVAAGMTGEITCFVIPRTV